MDRRDFIKLASLTGLTVVGSRAFAGGELGAPRKGERAPYTGPLYFNFQASGGWESRFHCDPKLQLSDNEGNPRSHVTASEQIGEIEFAAEWPTQFFGAGGFAITDWYRKHADHMTVINGIDQLTNGHDEGRRHTATGSLGTNYPTMGALMTASYDPSLPMGYLAFGGVTSTGGIVARTRANNLDALARVAYPELADPNNPDSEYAPAAVRELMTAAQEERDVALRAAQHLPRLQNSMDTLHAARSGSEELRKLQDFLPDQVEGGMNGQVQVAFAAYQAGLCVAADFSRGGFDTHSNSDTQAVAALESLLAAVDFAYDQAQLLGLEDKLIITVGSDFTRTLGYNGAMGADHWPSGSVLAMGPGIPQNRQVGATDDDGRPMGINPDLTVSASGAARRIQPRDVHYSLRKVVGIEDNELSSQFTMRANDEPIDLFA
ncbi:MAG: DUF1501 domain-containing protein [Myxococcota bacterium]